MAKGRPSIYSKKLAGRICDGLASGLSMRKICFDEAFPAQTTIYRWLRENEEFRQQYTQARTWQADTLFDECLDIADDGSNDWMADKDSETGERYNGDAVARSRLRVDTRKWMAGKLNAKKYGEKTDGDEVPKTMTVTWSE